MWEVTFLFLMGISMGKWPDFEYHVGKWLKYDRFGSNSSQPTLGPPLNLSDPWRPLATIGDMLEHGHVGNGQNQHCGKVFLKKSVSMTSFKSLQYFYLRLLPIDIIDWEGPCLLLFLYNETEGVKVKTAIFRFWKSNETGRSLGGREGGGLGNVKPLWNGLHMFL